MTHELQEREVDWSRETSTVKCSCGAWELTMDYSRARMATFNSYNGFLIWLKKRELDRWMRHVEEET